MTYFFFNPKSKISSHFDTLGLDTVNFLLLLLPHHGRVNYFLKKKIACEKVFHPWHNQSNRIGVGGGVSHICEMPIASNTLGQYCIRPA